MIIIVLLVIVIIIDIVVILGPLNSVALFQRVSGSP